MSELVESGSEGGDGWEEVVPTYEETHKSISFHEKQSSEEITSNPIEITLQGASSKQKKAELSERYKRIQAERVVRIESHKLHALCLLKNACIRNRWINDALLHARLLSLTPLTLQNDFTSITKKRIPDQGRRGRLFEGAVMRLTEWWYNTFRVEETGHIRSRTFRQDKIDVTFPEQYEVLRSSKSLMKRALIHCGSRDCSSILFAALCRALSIPTRLVVSLQPVPWQSNVAKSKDKAVGMNEKGKASAVFVTESYHGDDGNGDDDDDDDDDMEEVGIPDPDDTIISSPSMSASSSFEENPKASSLKKPDSLRRHAIRKHRRRNFITRSHGSKPPIGGWPPTIWVEVFSRPDARWMSVDPVRYIVNKKLLMEPPQNDRNNRMTYVVALEEDGYARDVTRRYAKEFQGKTVKTRVSARNGQQDWWSEVMSMLARPYPLKRDENENNELELAQYREGMPTSLAGFKNHPLYVLEKHLKQTEVIYPKEEVGRFRGEPVYPRSYVIALKTSENWTRMGRKVKAGCQPMKMIKAHAATINRRRAIEMARSQGEQVGMQGLYALDQTELYVPDPVIDGKIPRNDFGNIDLYTDSMLPKGGFHLPYQGVAKVARSLGIDFAEAVTSFEFRQGRAFPVLTGIVVAVENAELVREAYFESAQYEEEKRRFRIREKVLKLWSKLINGLRIQQRIQEQYGGGGPKEKLLFTEGSEPTPAGGFITDADCLVAPFSLPKPSGSLLDPDLQSHSGTPPLPILIQSQSHERTDFSLTPAKPLPPPPPSLITTTESGTEKIENKESRTDEESEESVRFNGTPITMQRLAEKEIRHRIRNKSRDAQADADAVNRENSPIRTETRRSNARRRRNRRAKVSASSDEDENDSGHSEDPAEGQEEAIRRAKRNRLGSNSIDQYHQHSRGWTLRPRRQKSEAKLRAEREAEELLLQALEKD